MSEPSKRYRAFISYSQKDKRAAIRVHRALESYIVPGGVDAPGLTPKQRKLGRFFRDDDEMGAATDLGAALRGSIADSESLVVVCSPNAARSHWVNEEILHFKRTGRSEKIFAVIVTGRPDVASPEDGGCFPPALRFEIGPDGALGTTPTEPLGIDLRKQSLARSRARLAAGLLDVPFDALWRRDRRRATLRSALASVAACVALVLAGVLASQLNERNSNQLAALAAEDVDAGRYDRAARYARLGLIGSDWWLIGFDGSAAEAQLRRSLSARPDPNISYPFQPATALAFSPDGTTLATGTREGTLQLWSVDRGHGFSDAWRGHAGAIQHLVFSPDNLHLATASADDTVRIWDLSDTHRGAGRIGVALVPPLQQASVTNMAFSPDGSRLAVATRDSGVQLWNIQSGAALRLSPREQQSWITRVTFSPDGARLAAGMMDGTAAMWDARTGASLGEPLQGHTSTIGVMKFSPDGATLATGSTDATARLWDARSGEPIGEPLPLHAGEVTDLAFSPNRTTLATVSLNGVVALWHARSGAVLTAPQHTSEDWVSVTFSADGTHLATAARDGAVQLWDARTGAPLGRPLDGHEGYVRAMAFSPDGERLATALQDGRTHMWTLDNALTESRQGLMRRSCDTILAAGGSILMEEDLRRAPMLNPTADTDACAATMWRRFLFALAPRVKAE